MKDNDGEAELKEAFRVNQIQKNSTVRDRTCTEPELEQDKLKIVEKTAEDLLDITLLRFNQSKSK